MPTGLSGAARAARCHTEECEEVSSSNSRHRLPNPPSFLLRVLFTGLIAAAFMSTFEAIKQWVDPKIGIWQSHAATIMLTVMIATVAMFVGLRRYELLNRQLR